MHPLYALCFRQQRHDSHPWAGKQGQAEAGEGTALDAELAAGANMVSMLNAEDGRKVTSTLSKQGPC